MIVRTVLGDLPPADLGLTYGHEHLIIDSVLVADRWPHILLDSVDDAVTEMASCRAAGVRSVVDAMPAASGRDASRLAEVSRRAGVNVVASTGLHTEKYYESMPWTWQEDPDTLADLFVADLEVGIDAYDYTGPVVRRTSHRAGVVKTGWLAAAPSERDRRVFEAVAQTHARTGAPVLSHCEAGLGGMAQVAMLDRLGVPLDRVALSHTDKVADLGYHEDLLSTGVLLGYDQALRDPAATARLVVAMVGSGHASHLMLGTDGARRSLWSALGGAPGLAWLAGGFSRRLLEQGIDRATLDVVFIANPARYLSFEPSG